MAKCKCCGKPARFMSDLCPACIDIAFKNSSAQAGAAQGGQPPAKLAARPIDETRSTAGNAGFCITLGILFLLIGGYLLLLSPSEDGAELLGRSVVSMHRLVIGQTSSIMGTVFLAVGIRPR